MLEQITPIILTYNEETNIERTLNQLQWARDILILDSFSTDKTLEITKRFKQVRILQRKFDHFAFQRNYALQEGNIKSEWMLILDADYVLTDELIQEINSLAPGTEIDAYSVPFIYMIHGYPLRSCLYPLREVLVKKGHITYERDGHSEKAIIRGNIQSLKNSILHDDQKPLSVWLQSQWKYAQEEAVKLTQMQPKILSLPDRIRQKKCIAPWLVLIYCLFWRGLILDGFPGLFYSFQRMYAECLLSLLLVEKYFKSTKKTQ